MLSPYPYQNVALIRDALLVLLMVMVVWEILRRNATSCDRPVTTTPTGGPFTDAPDRFTVPSLRAMLGLAKLGVTAAEHSSAEPASGLRAAEDGSAAVTGADQHIGRVRRFPFVLQ